MTDQGSEDAADVDPSDRQISGAGTVDDARAPLRFGQSPAFGGSDASSGPEGPFAPRGPAEPSTVPGPSPFQSGVPPTWVAPPPLVTGRQSPRRTGRVAVAVIVLAGLCFLGFGAAITSWLDRVDPGPADYSYGEVATTAAYGSSAPLAPAVVEPPADAAGATTAIVEVYQRVFQPGQSSELWNAMITEPAGLQERIRPFGASDCAVGVQTVVTQVQFTGNDSARVQLRFEGPNVPEFGRSYLFSGGAERQADGAWKATPEAINQVADLAGGYCS